MNSRLTLIATACLALSACGGSDSATETTRQRSAMQAPVMDEPLLQDELARIGAGVTFAAGMDRDGHVYAWGNNDYGQLGQGHLASSLVPVQVPGLSGVATLAVGDYHTLALKNDGQVWGWGSNHYGQLGLGKNSGAALPVRVPGLSGVRVISANNYLTVAAAHDGSVWTLGRSGNASNLVAAKVQGLDGVTAVAAGWDYALAVRNDGSVWGWGSNSVGQLGASSKGNSTVKTPTRIGGIDNVVNVAAAMLHALALRKDGSVWTWGSNTYGQMGVPVQRSGPVAVPGLPLPVNGASGVKQIAAGNYNSAVLYADGTVWAWGANHFGQLADGTQLPRSQPTRLHTIGDVAAMAVSDGFVIFLQANGALQAAGNNQYGTLGNNTRSNSTLPVPVSGRSGVGTLNLGPSRAN